MSEKKYPINSIPEDIWNFVRNQVINIFIKDIDAYLNYLKTIDQEKCAGNEYWKLKKMYWEEEKK